jgi:hypothetical protein
MAIAPDAVESFLVSWAAHFREDQIATLYSKPEQSIGPNWTVADLIEREKKIRSADPVDILTIFLSDSHVEEIRESIPLTSLPRYPVAAALLQRRCL